MLFFKSISKPINDALIKIISPQLGVTVGGFYIENAVGNSQQRDIEGATTEVKHQRSTYRTSIEAVGKGRCCGFIEDPLN